MTLHSLDLFTYLVVLNVISRLQLRFLGWHNKHFYLLSRLSSLQTENVMWNGIFFASNFEVFMQRTCLQEIGATWEQWSAELWWLSFVDFWTHSDATACSSCPPLWCTFCSRLWGQQTDDTTHAHLSVMFPSLCFIEPGSQSVPRHTSDLLVQRRHRKRGRRLKPSFPNEPLAQRPLESPCRFATSPWNFLRL